MKEKKKKNKEMTPPVLTKACTEYQKDDFHRPSQTSFVTRNQFVYFHVFIVAIGCPSERRPQKTISCCGG